ncbi:MAG: SOS response-associated peptidase [Tepidisphaera sp.]
MCGRFTSLYKWRELVKLMRATTLPLDPLDDLADPVPRYNIAPTHPAAILTLAPRPTPARWGFEAHGKAIINATAENLEDRPLFRDHLRSGRAVVPMSGFYEWKGDARSRQPLYFTRTDDEIMLVAGLVRTIAAPPRLEFVIITAAANPDMDPVHDRMPVILSPQSAEAWLRLGDSLPRSLLLPSPPGTLKHRPVSPRVNKVAADDPSLLDPYTIPQAGLWG